MPVPQISRGARAAVTQRLAHSTTGFTPLLNASMSDAALATPIGWKLPITFGSPSYNFFQADIKPERIKGTTTVTYPLITVFTLASANKNRQKFQMFSGPIELGLNVFLSWKSGKALPDFETAGDCIEEALYQCFNATAIASWAVGPTIVYNGGLTIQRSDLEEEGEHWFQRLAGRLELEAVVNA